MAQVSRAAVAISATLVARLNMTAFIHNDMAMAINDRGHAVLLAANNGGIFYWNVDPKAKAMERRLRSTNAAVSATSTRLSTTLTQNSVLTCECVI